MYDVRSVDQLSRSYNLETISIATRNTRARAGPPLPMPLPLSGTGDRGLCSLHYPLAVSAVRRTQGARCLLLANMFSRDVRSFAYESRDEHPGVLGVARERREDRLRLD